jgi:hypothetical protein
LYMILELIGVLNCRMFPTLLKEDKIKQMPHVHEEQVSNLLSAQLRG